MGIWARDDVTGAFAAQLDDRRRAAAAGDRPIGWKLGFGSAAAQHAAGVDAPFVGHLLESGRRASGTQLSVQGWTAPALEPEIAVYLGADVPAGASDSDIADAIAAISLAFELVDITAPLSDAIAVMKANIFQRGVVLGDRMPASLHPAAVTILVDGAVHAEVADPVTAVGDYVELVRHVADVLAASGEALRAGEVIITGMVAPPLQLSSGHYAMRGDGLGEIELSVGE